MAPTCVGLALLSAAALAFEITLTRLFSVTQWYHFAFLAVSVALLGYGASGTALSLVPRWTHPPTDRRTSILALLFAVAVIGAYLSLNYLPFDSYRIAWERIQLLYLILYYLALTVPFLCAGMATGLLLAAYPDMGSQIYAANLLGSALGGLLPLLALPLAGEGAVLILSALGLLAALIFQVPRLMRSRLVPIRIRHFAFSLLLLAGGVALVVFALHLPRPFTLRISPYKSLSQVLRFPDAEVTRQDWNAFSRVDLVRSSAIRSAPGLSLSCPGELPREDGLFVDGDSLSPVLIDPSDVQEFTECLPVALPYQLREGGRALVLEARGGLDIWVALSQGAASVVSVESNPRVVQAAGQVYQDDRVLVELEEGRSYARRSVERFDVVHLALHDGYQPVTSGAYGLGERYDLTVEAFEDYLARLRPAGLLVVERWLQLPPSELLRAGAAAIEALRRQGVEDPAGQLVVLRSWQLGIILVKNGGFSGQELAAIRDFSRAHELDLVALPDLREAETNQRNVLQEPVYYLAFRKLLADPDALYATHEFDVRPPADDRPFFFHYFKWSQAEAVFEQLGKTWQPWGGSGYFVLIALLAVAAVLSSVLILLPIALSKRWTAEKGPRMRVLLYFGSLGLAFLFVEIPLMQRFILFLGQPVYSFAAVAATVLFFSGLGSLLSPRLSTRWVIPLLAVAILLYPLILPLLFRVLLGLSWTVRLFATVLMLAPLGFLMGMPFPRGLSWLQERAPHLIPWGWAVNGCTSVLASVLAAMVALSAGFTWVLAAAALTYIGAWLAFH